MLQGIVVSAALIVFTFLVYAFLPYNRNKEKLKFLSCDLFVLVVAIIYMLVKTSSIPDEICRNGYKWWFGFSYVVGTLFWDLAIFYLFSNALRAKKYFARITEYIF